MVWLFERKIKSIIVIFFFTVTFFIIFLMAEMQPSTKRANVIVVFLSQKEDNLHIITE